MPVASTKPPLKLHKAAAPKSVMVKPAACFPVLEIGRRRAHAEEVSGDDTQHDEHGHVRGRRSFNFPSSSGHRFGLWQVNA